MPRWGRIQHVAPGPGLKPRPASGARAFDRAGAGDAGAAGAGRIGAAGGPAAPLAQTPAKQERATATIDDVQLFDTALSVTELAEAADANPLPERAGVGSMPPVTLLGDEPPLERDGETATVVSKYYYLNGLRIAKAVDGNVTWIHSDHLHSATILTDETGAEIRLLAYAAFGEEAENVGSGDAPKYSYTGKELDSSGLMYYGARYYDPALSRFITADTVYDAGPQGLNRYAYALNNPIRYHDPSGNTAEAAQYALETQYDALPYIDEVDTGNNLADQVLAVGAGIYNLGAMLVNALPNAYGVTEEAYNAGTEAVIGQKGLSGNGLTTDLAILEAVGMPFGSLIEQIRNSSAYVKMKFPSKALTNDATNRLELLRSKYGEFSSKELNQRINLRGAVKEQYSKIVSEPRRGPVLSGVMDKKTDKIFFGQNRNVPVTRHSLLDSRLQAYPSNWQSIYPKGSPGSHSEFRALNEALLARPDAAIDDFMIYNVWLKGSKRGFPIPRCPHCESLTDGAQFIPEVLKYTR